LSATPNGKNHGCDKLSSQKTLRAGSHARPFGRKRFPASVTQLASSQLSINKRHRRSSDPR